MEYVLALAILAVVFIIGREVLIRSAGKHMEESAEVVKGFTPCSKYGGQLLPSECF